jgi:hypothetical protein
MARVARILDHYFTILHGRLFAIHLLRGLWPFTPP